MARSFFFIFLLLASCNTNDDGKGGCLQSSSNAVFLKTDPISPKNIFINLVDTNGNNLIENKTYTGADITIDYDQTQITGVVFEEVESIKNFIQVTAYGSEGKNIYHINLNDSERDEMIVNLIEVSFSPCTGPRYDVESVIYNDEEKTLLNFSGQYMITVVK